MLMAHVVHIFNNLGGARAARFRTKYALRFLSLLGGNETIVDSLKLNREQESMDRSSSNPRVEVEVEGGRAPVQGLVLQGDLFGEFTGDKIRKTDETPPIISVFDLIGAVTGVQNPAHTWAKLGTKIDDEVLSKSYNLP